MGIHLLIPTSHEMCRHPDPFPQSHLQHQSEAVKRKKRQSSGDSQRKPVSELERQHKEILKREQYASHCQICLCARPPLELAPVGSYVEWEEVRRRIMEAHHVDLKSAGGAEHAGNLILLCRFHHNNYGRRLSRASLVAELRKKTRKKVVRYEGEDGEVTEVKGRTIRVEFPDKGDSVDIFLLTITRPIGLSDLQFYDFVQLSRELASSNSG